MSKKIDTSAKDLDDLIKLLAKLFLIYIFNICNSTKYKL